MSRKVFASFFLALVLGTPGCKEQAIAPAASDTQAAASPGVTEARKQSTSATVDACALLTREEIQAIQGSSIKETKSNARGEGEFRVSQCVYVAEEFVKSVSLAVTYTNPERETKRTPKDFWQETFGRYKSAEETADKDKPGTDGEPGVSEEKKKKRPPRRIDGLGDDAYWSSGVTSALHVLKNDMFIFISLGGPDNDETKLNNSRALAEKALSRL